MGRPFTQDELDCISDLQSRLVKGDRVRCYACPGTARTITFSRFDGQWIESISGFNSYHPIQVISINKIPYRHAGSAPENYK